MRVLGLINSLGQGGAERSLIDLVRAMSQEFDIATDIFTTRTVDHGFEHDTIAAGVDVRVLPEGAPAQLLNLRRQLKARHYDLIWTTLWEADLLGRLSAWGSGIPVLTSLVNTSYDPIRRQDPRVQPWKLEIARALDGWTARHLTAHFHAISDAVARHAVDQLGISMDSITVIPRGRRSEDFPPIGHEQRVRVRGEFGLSVDGLMIVNVGRHEFQKGQEHLIDAMAGVASAIPDAMLVIAGRSGNTTSQLEQRVAMHGLENRIHLLGDRRDVPTLLGAADLFVFPSLYEGLGGALIEAMASRLPIIASDLPAIAEAVGTSAILLPPGDSVALAKAIIELSVESQLREKLAAGALARFNRSFTLQQTTRQTAELLQSIGNQGPR